MASAAYDGFNDAWKSTCRIMLGEEIGELGEYEKYLTKYLEPVRTEKSQISDKEVTIAYPYFCKGARFISNDEVPDYLKKSREKISINSIKDIDSLADALSEVFVYSGNTHVGNCHDIESSDLCTNSQAVFRSTEVYNAKFIVYTSLSREDEYTFGSNCLGECRFLIRSYYTHQLTRGMECFCTYTTSDSYYCAHMWNCGNCMFSFNQKNRRNMIGNNELPPAEYTELRKKLVSEIRETLKAKKDAPSIFDIMVT